MDREADSKLKAACYDYYTTQNLLAKAEDEHLQLRSIVAQLEERVKARKDEIARINEVCSGVDEEREKEAELPAGVPVAAFDAFINEERRLLAEAAKAEDEAALFEAECEQLERHVTQEGRSAAVLEGALDAQVKFSEVLRATDKAGGAKVDIEHEKQAGTYARNVACTKELDRLQKRETLLRKALAGLGRDRSKMQELLQDRDSDVVRLRRDAAVSRRLHMGELEHAREQEAELQRLTTENRRLRSMVEERRAGRPSLGKSGHGPDEHRDTNRSSADPCRAEATAGGRTVPLVVESNDEVENIALAEASGKKCRQNSTSLDRAREHNVALLQQMVATMQALRVAVEPVQGA